MNKGVHVDVDNADSCGAEVNRKARLRQTSINRERKSMPVIALIFVAGVRACG